MLRIESDRPQPLCDKIDRRELMRIGALHIAGLTLPALLRGRALASTVPVRDSMFGRAKNVIWLYLAGGPSQFETFDPKPDAPAEVRGIFNPISTNVPGIQICELLPRTARIADKLAIVRSISTNDNNHESGGYWINTGHKYVGPNMRSVNPTDWPCLSAMVKMLHHDKRSPLRAVHIPEAIVANPNILMPGQNGGFMGRSWDPELFTCDPSAARLDVKSFTAPGDVPSLRLTSRRSLLEQLNHYSRLADQREIVSGHDTFAAQALDLLLSGAAQTAFAIDREPDSVRSRYGRGKWGQSVLLARRLIEAGVRMVFVKWPREPGDLNSNSPCWDTHAGNNERMKEVLCPQFDLGFTALIDDLSQRGLLDETLVVAIGEMGRTPKFNPAGGRDHWGYVFPCVLAGAGIAGAQVWGASDKTAAYPSWGRVTPDDIAATLFHLLGIPHETIFHDLNGRPMRATEGTPMYGILGTKPATDQRTTPGGQVPESYGFSTEPLVNLDFENPPRLAPIGKRTRGWQASPTFAPCRDEFAVHLGRVPDVRSRSGEHHVGLGYGLATGRGAGMIAQGATAILAQEIFNPMPGTFTFSVHASGGANESPEHYRQVFLENFTCRIVIFGFLDDSRDVRKIREYASQKIEPDFAGPYESSYKKFSVSVELKSQQDDARQLDHGIGVAVILEKTSAGVLDLAASSERQQGFVRLDDVELEYVPAPPPAE